MQYKVLRSKFLNHKGEFLKKDEIFTIDEKNYKLKPFYERREKDGDIKKFEERKKVEKTFVSNNKSEGSKNG